MLSGVPMTNNHDKKQLSCHLCSRPVNLAQDTVSDEHGEPVHQECYVEALLLKRPNGITVGTLRPSV